MQEQIFKMVLRGHIDFKTDPWPKISDAAKDCVKRLLEQVHDMRHAAYADMQEAVHAVQRIQTCRRHCTQRN